MIAPILSPEEFARVMQALKLMREIDAEHRYIAEVEKSDALIERLKKEFPQPEADS